MPEIEVKIRSIALGQSLKRLGTVLSMYEMSTCFDLKRFSIL